ncbi:hypothetical protein ABX026_04775 [Snodgrassella alvi]
MKKLIFLKGIKILKKILLFILIFISNNAFSKIILVDEMLNNLDNKIQANYIIINQLSEIILKRDIDIYQQEWEKEVNKKCNWVYSNIDIYLFGQKDKFSYPLCLLNEQNAMINELILLMNHKKILVNNEIQQYFTNIPEQKQYNIYFNLLTEKYALKFCSSLYPSTNIKECINRFLLTQYIPEEYGFKLSVDKGYLYDSPNLSDKTKIYLVRGDQIKLLSYKNNFYKIEYTSKENKIIKKWLHCSAINACISD